VDLVILEFEDKVEEINEYFEFVKITTHLRGFSDNTDMIQVSQTVHNVLKANMFLLLYNLVESSFKNALENICLQITNDRLKYQNVIPEIKKIWINKEYRNFEQQCTLPRDMSKPEFIMNKIDTIAEDMILLTFNDELSGNVTSTHIKALVKEYGLNSDEVNNRDSEASFIVKGKRNSLAHGNESFNECGRGYAIERLENIKNESIDYMRFILEHIQIFIEEKKYAN